MNSKPDNLKYLVVAVLAILNFFFAYSSFHHESGTITKTTRDGLSGEQYAPTTNEENPYGPYFVGFDILNSRGVSSDNLRYIYDVLTNYTMYNKKAYAAKVSYVNNSFKRQTVSGIEPKYSFRFGINDKSTGTVTVSSSIITGDFTISIVNKNNKQEFSKIFFIQE
jgi:hypothetical protein